MLYRFMTHVLQEGLSFAEVYALLGPASSGKSFGVMLLVTFRGQGN